jgi:hypothetical protein
LRPAPFFGDLTLDKPRDKGQYKAGNPLNPDTPNDCDRAHERAHDRAHEYLCPIQMQLYSVNRERSLDTCSL